jgi:hypothetical protein
MLSYVYFLIEYYKLHILRFHDLGIINLPNIHKLYILSGINIVKFLKLLREVSIKERIGCVHICINKYLL